MVPCSPRFVSKLEKQSAESGTQNTNERIALEKRAAELEKRVVALTKELEAAKAENAAALASDLAAEKDKVTKLQVELDKVRWPFVGTEFALPV
jgi:ribosomal protein L9